MKSSNAFNEDITNHALFHGMKTEHLAVLLDGAKKLEFNVGDVVFQEGEPASKFYLIEKGKIALEAHEPADGTMLVQNLGPGDALGWSWLFTPFSWHFQTRATREQLVGLEVESALKGAAQPNALFAMTAVRCWSCGNGQCDSSR